MAEYFEALEVWEGEVNDIQGTYEAEIELYRADAEIYQAELVEFQTAMAEWQGARAVAVQPAEAMVRQVYTDFGWTFVNKENRAGFIGKIASTWAAQLVISSILFGGILVLQKRKDVV